LLKVGILSSDNPHKTLVGGKHVHLYLLERALKQMKINFSTCYYEPNVFDTFDMYIRAAFSRFTKMFGNEKVSVRNAIASVDRKLRFFENVNLNVDVVHCHDTVAIAKLRTQVPKILTLHGYFAREALNYFPFSEKWKSMYYDHCLDVEKSAYKRADFIITVDTRIRDYVVANFEYPVEKTAVIYNAVDTDNFRPVTDSEKREIRRKLKIPEDKFVVLVPRRYVMKNGVLYAAQAFEKLRADNRFFFLFIGRGPLKSQIFEILRDNNNALVGDYVDYRDNVWEYYQAADVVLIPSITSENIQEATSLSMLESMSCGKITVCTNIGGMAEIIRDTQNGILIPEKDIDAIADTLVDLCDNYHSFEHVMQEARKYVVQNSSYIVHARKIVEIYNKVMLLT